MTDKKHRYNARMDRDTYDQVLYWASERGMSMSEYLEVAALERVRKEVGDYDLPNLEAVRLNQLVESVIELRDQVEALARIVNVGFESLISLTRGDTMFLRDDWMNPEVDAVATNEVQP